MSSDIDKLLAEADTHGLHDGSLKEKLIHRLADALRSLEDQLTSAHELVALRDRELAEAQKRETRLVNEIAAERDSLRAALDLILSAVPDGATECAVVMRRPVIELARRALDGESG